MKVLVLGGTKFLGRHLAQSALDAGHEVTLFTRGQTNPELFPEAEHLVGDRDGDLSALEGRGWDSVVDTSGYLPRVVRNSAELLRDAVDQYVFVSSLSVYRSQTEPGLDESAPVIELDDPAVEEVMEFYGGLKAACEQVVEEIFPGRAAHIRAGLLVGPHDPTDRFTYWPRRVADGGEVLAPGPPERPLQFVDARDLGSWLVELAERRTAGTFNATGPSETLSFEELLETCKRVSGSDARLTWVDEQLLLEYEVGEWMELPLWVSQTNAEFSHLHEVDISRALAAGLRFRPLAETVRDTLAWAESDAGAGAGTAAMGSTGGVGLARERERKLLDAWRVRT